MENEILDEVYRQHSALEQDFDSRDYGFDSQFCHNFFCAVAYLAQKITLLPDGEKKPEERYYSSYRSRNETSVKPKDRKITFPYNQRNNSQVKATPVYLIV